MHNETVSTGVPAATKPWPQKVYLKLSVRSNSIFPLLCLLFAYQKYIVKITTITMIRICEPMLTQIAVMYLGASFCLTMKLPAIPPSPLHAVIAAAKVARFHCPKQNQRWEGQKSWQEKSLPTMFDV
jgi:hypothetical protein